jgi:hypothetical protein
MQWIKRNLVIVIGGAVALALLAFAGFYLLAKIQVNNTVTEELEKATSRLKSLANRNPHPGTDQVDNISEAKREAQRLTGFRNEVAAHFEAPPFPAELNNQQFGTLLDDTIYYLRSAARRESVEIPTNYWFTFEAQKGAMTFTPASLQPLASQLADIRAICEVLFDAKVNRLVGIKRVPVDREGTLGSQDYLSIKATTNDWTIIAPYEVTFQGFTSELASVLEGLVRQPHCIIVTNMVVQPATSSSSQMQELMPGFADRYGLQGGVRPGMDPSMADRYGLGGGRGRGGREASRYGGFQPPPQMMMPVAPPPRTSLNLVDEQALQYTLHLQVVKLKPQPVTKSARHAVPQE